MGKIKLRWANAKLLILLDEQKLSKSGVEDCRSLGFTSRALNLANVSILNRRLQHFLQ